MLVVGHIGGDAVNLVEAEVQRSLFDSVGDASSLNFVNKAYLDGSLSEFKTSELILDLFAGDEALPENLIDL